MAAVQSRELPWREPWTVAKALTAHFGTNGLAWLDGDGSPLGATAFLGADPREVVVCRGLPGSPGARDPFLALDDLQRRGGAWLGWLAYEAGAWVEPGGRWHHPELPTLWAARYDPLLRFDLTYRRLWLGGDDPARLSAWADLVADLSPQQAPPEPPGQPIDPALWHWHTSGATFAAQVEQLLERIAAGDLFQANLTACCEVLLPEPPDPLALYQRLRLHCPAPFGGLVVAGDAAVLCASPERFLRVSPDGRIETRPIKGTRPRHGDPEADAAAAAALITSPKDRAENVMIVDLLRNDLGRVCVPGSIQVPQLVGLESYRQVHHLTSVVEGQLRADRTVVELLRACWPGGSISGAPKIRACQRLGELEPLARGPYCGSLFRFGADDSFDSNLLIRSVMLQGRRLRAHAGCGIVADSDPAGEAEELGWKLQPLLEALA
ncbi:anthranilate synthase component I family protein [Synechococcus sp. Tobar12-5m-g]|uniref:anthranilate synthase component I family protein n=1 Tax=unclassified Synechococcus TaxID=2626047 RepID=UPI0020CF72F7|nr:MULTISPECIES: anthranilate synthase component I family protein [unclassified Synechococcus]MCP9771978.1 anthranilate synthase component I family protein [Synechococcus sp. Tobar12-5m-g]MCP9872920.1 anthranilate synthase component I family protein [Synechococcus sp. Cruz CV-v-12]